MMDNSDPKLGRVVELAVEECRTRTPLLHVRATSGKRGKDFCIFFKIYYTDEMQKSAYGCFAAHAQGCLHQTTCRK